MCTQIFADQMCRFSKFYLTGSDRFMMRNRKFHSQNGLNHEKGFNQFILHQILLCLILFSDFSGLSERPRDICVTLNIASIVLVSTQVHCIISRIILVCHSFGCHSMRKFGHIKQILDERQFQFDTHSISFIYTCFSNKVQI